MRTLTSSASVLTAAEIEAVPYREPGEVLRPLPGMGFTYYGQGGIPSGPTVRGYTDRNFGQDIAGFLDRIPLNLHGFVASHGALDLTVVPPEVLDRVELVRGPIEARYGDFNRGGTLNLVTRDGVARPSITASGGSYGTWNLGAEYGNHRTGSGPMALYSSLGSQGTGGYADNQDLWHHRLFNRLLVPLGRGDVTFTALNGWSRWDAPGYLDKAAALAGQVNERDAVNPTDGGRLQHNLFAVRYRVGADVARPLEATFHVGVRDWQRWRQDVLLGPTQPQVRQSDERTTWGFRVEQTWGQFIGARPLLFTVGTALHRADAETRQARTELREFVAWNDDVDEVMTDLGVYAQGQVGLTDRIKAVAGLRYSRVDYDIEDNLRQPGQFVSEYSAGKWQPKLGAVFAPHRVLELYTNYVVGMRSPTPRTEVRNSIGSIDRVQIAETESYEIGATIRPLARMDVDATWWRADNSNEIRGIPPGGAQFESLGESRRHGASVDVRWFFPWGTRISGGLSRVNARLLTPLTPGATHLPDIPDYVHQIGVLTPLGAPATVAGRFSAGGLTLVVAAGLGRPIRFEPRWIRSGPGRSSTTGRSGVARRPLARRFCSPAGRCDLRCNVRGRAQRSRGGRRVPAEQGGGDRRERNVWGCGPPLGSLQRAPAWCRPSSRSRSEPRSSGAVRRFPHGLPLRIPVGHCPVPGRLLRGDAARVGCSPRSR